ncbi:MAG TPA: carbamoyltransferase HypF [Anaerolineales bacterium]|nr:carbamoyltransferase HypF [Anaerolineales bacterium]
MTQAERVVTPSAKLVHVTGVVQGVGFRPFVYNLAERLGLSGWVRNTSSGVDIEVRGPEEEVQRFLSCLRSEAPPLAHIEHLVWETCLSQADGGFRILPSLAAEGEFQRVAADVATCDACLRELFDPADRRYRYPFINCTHCGPRLTIIERMPYDRPYTTMAEFEMCAACAAEYHDPSDRRFHAQPIACPDCGPVLEWLADGRSAFGEEALHRARSRIADGGIVAVKGLGGFHLACDATSAAAVGELRRRKGRGDKPFAVMFLEVEAVERHTHLDRDERGRLTGRDRPIVVLARRPESPLPLELAPGQKTVGAMLPYTPLHHLLLEREANFPEALVMTSGNRTEEPIAIDNAEAMETLRGIADGWLVHDRRIHQRCDDSVTRVFRAGPYLLRRSRGLVPTAVDVPELTSQLLACGAELKNTFCLARDGAAFLGPHIGDLQNAETLAAFEQAVARFETLFQVRPEHIACDMHPDYLATRYAIDRAQRDALPMVSVQHHHAHIVACLVDAGRPAREPVIGLALDGLGYGEDGALWGGEVLRVEGARMQRLGHLAYVPQPGGDAAARQPWRMALAWLDHAGLEWEEDLPAVRTVPAATREVIRQMLRADARVGLPAPLTSSVGRLFDGMAALLGVRQEVRDEAQAAIELEALVDPAEAGAYSFSMERMDFDAAPVFRSAVSDLRSGVSLPRMAARFHRGLAAAMVEVAGRARAETGIGRVALSGGVWQNMVLLRQTVEGLEAAGFDVLIHRRVPANDGGLALGQAVVAALAAVE